MTFGWFFAFAATTALVALFSYFAGFVMGLEAGRNQTLAEAIRKSTINPSVN